MGNPLYTEGIRVAGPIMAEDIMIGAGSNGTALGTIGSVTISYNPVTNTVTKSGNWSTAGVTAGMKVEGTYIRPNTYVKTAGASTNLVLTRHPINTSGSNITNASLIFHNPSNNGAATTAKSSGLEFVAGSNITIAASSSTEGRPQYTFASTASGTGDVEAAANFATDNVLIRSDGTSKGVQFTGITVADTTDNMSGIGTLSCGAITSTGTSIFATLDISGNIDVDGTTNLDVVDIDGAVQLDATLTVGADDQGYDVKFFGDTASAYMMWDTNVDDLVLAGAAGIDLAGDIDVDGTANLDNVDIDGTVQIDGATIFGVNGTGVDVKFFGDTSGRYAIWDEGRDALVFTDAAKIELGTGTDMTLYHDGTNSYITNAVGVLKIATETSGIAVTIGHGTSEVTVADNLTVTGNLSVSGTTTTISSTVSTIADPLIELNTGAGSNANDLGFIMERGSTGNNACFLWDESNTGFVVGTTTATGASTGNITFAAAKLQTGALTSTTIAATTGTFSGVLKTDDTTAATTTTDGSLQTDGGLSVVLDAVIGDDLFLKSDSAVFNMGAGNDFTITHDGTTGAVLAGNPITLDSAANLVFDAGDGYDVVYQEAGTTYYSVGLGSADITNIADSAGATAIDVFDCTAYQAVKYFILVEDITNDDYMTAEILLLGDDVPSTAVAYMTIYAVIWNSTELGVFTATGSGNNITLNYDPTEIGSDNHRVRVVAQRIASLSDSGQ